MAIKITDCTASPLAVLIHFKGFNPTPAQADALRKVASYRVQRVSFFPNPGGPNQPDAEITGAHFDPDDPSHQRPTTILGLKPGAAPAAGEFVEVTVKDPTDNGALVKTIVQVILPQTTVPAADVPAQLAALDAELRDVKTAVVGALNGGQQDSVTATIKQSSQQLGAGLQSSADGTTLTGAVKSVATAIGGLSGTGGGGFSTLPRFPLQTRSTNGDVGGAPVSIQAKVDGALRTVLGRLPRASDTRSFVNSLNTSFDAREVDGATVLTWTPRTYAGQTDLGGGVTGAQASLVTFAKHMLDSSLPLLDGLEPLVTTADPEELASARSILRTEWVEFVNELSNEGGPRQFRADDLMSRIRGTPRATPVPGEVAGHLGDLGRVLGMLKADTTAGGALKVTHDNVINPAEEADLTNFIVIRDYVAAVDQSWQNYKNPAGGTPHDLGSGLVLLSRALSVVRESVAETTDAMDGVNVGDAERLTVELTLPTVDAAGAPVLDSGGNPVRTTIFLEDLLRWVAHFAADEAPALIYDGGMNGVRTITGTLNKLKGLVGAFHGQISSATPVVGIPEGLREPPVVVAAQELFTALDHSLTQATKILT